jgi:hypothetical protein
MGEYPSTLIQLDIMTLVNSIRADGSETLKVGTLAAIFAAPQRLKVLP